jgi:hypothetical protein
MNTCNHGRKPGTCGACGEAFMRETERAYGGGDVRDDLLAAVEKWKGEAASLRAQLADREREVATRREQVDSLATANEAANRRAEAAEREREEARAEVEALRTRAVGCASCGGWFGLEDLDGRGECATCRAPPPPETETPEERNARIESWSCPEPGCSILGAHEGPHRTMVGHGDIDTVEWTTPGAYLDALRPLARAAAQAGEG